MMDGGPDHNITQQSKKKKFDTGCNMHKLPQHSTQRKKSETKGHLASFHMHEKPGRKGHQHRMEMKNCQGLGGGGAVGEDCLMDMVSLWGDENALELEATIAQPQECLKCH